MSEHSEHSVLGLWRSFRCRCPDVRRRCILPLFVDQIHVMVELVDLDFLRRCQLTQLLKLLQLVEVVGILHLQRLPQFLNLLTMEGQRVL